MAFTTLKTTQKEFLETYLRGTDRTLTSAQADALYGIKNLRARIFELRSVGLNVKNIPLKTERRSAYKMSRRDVTGSQAMIFSN